MTGRRYCSDIIALQIVLAGAMVRLGLVHSGVDAFRYSVTLTLTIT